MFSCRSWQRKIIVYVLVFLLTISWFFTGWPILVKEAQAASPEVFTGDATFTASTGIYAVTVECWGGGGGGGNINNSGGGGGGGGAYVKSTNVSVAPGTGYAVDIGTGGGQEQGGADSTFNVSTVVADGGLAGINGGTGPGGTTANSTGNAIKSAGGGGGTGDSGTSDAGGGGGGAGGPNGAGLNGQNGNNGSSGYGGNGGDSNQGIGVGDGGLGQAGAVGLGGGTDLTYGGGGGGGGDDQFNGGGGGTPGGGGGGAGDNEPVAGSGAPGRCIVSYADTWVPSTALATYSSTWSFASAPANVSASGIGMTATTGYDYTGPISYLFELDNSSCGANAGVGGSSGGWQASTSFSNSGLSPNRCYGYKVTARDSVGTPNTGTVSSISPTYTSANIPGTPVLATTGATTLALTNDANSNPSSNPTTNFAVQVVTTSPSDATWLNKWVDASGNPSESEVWIDDSTLDALSLRGLAGGTTYGIKVKARNQDNDETVLSAEGQGTTSVAVSISITTDGLIDFNYLAVGGSVDTFGLSHPETISIDSGTANLNIRSAAFVGVGSTWALGAASGADQVLWQFSKNGSSWTDFAVAGNEYTFDTGVVSPATRNVYLRLYMPSNTNSFVAHSAEITVVASSP